MKTSRKIKVFDSLEELKWHYHEKFCKGDSSAFYFMDQCVKEKNVNEWLERMGEPCRIKES